MAHILVFFVGLILSTQAHAKDFGTCGHTFPIIEEDFSQYLRHKVSQLSPEKIEEVQNKLQQRYKKALTRPTPVPLQEAKAYRRFYYDPTIITQANIRDHQGNVIIAKGSRYNPLESFSLTQELLFFNGDDPQHVEWAKKSKGKWVLTKGKPIDLEEEEKRPVFFDQFGRLTKQLGISKVPSKVSQEGKRLRVEEIPIEQEVP